MKHIITSLLLSAVMYPYAQNTLPSTEATPAGKSRVAAERTIMVEPAIAVADSGVQRLIVWLNDWESLLQKEEGLGDANPERASNLNQSKSNRKNLNSSRSNLYRVSGALNKLKKSNIGDRASTLEALRIAVNDLEQPMQDLYQSVLDRGDKYATHAAEVKSHHDTVKSSIGNIR